MPARLEARAPAAVALVWLACGLSGLGCARIDEDLLTPPPSTDAGAMDAGASEAPPDGAAPDTARAADASVDGALDGGDAGGDGALPDPTACRPNPDTEDEVCSEICPEVCNGEDDDCDLRIDEAKGLLPCALDRAMGACLSGQCRIVGCEPGFEDCDDQVDNGCEADLGSLDHCGGCDQACAFDHADPVCQQGECRRRQCDSGWEDCDGDGLDCEADLAAPATCGSCDNACSYDQASALCSAGSCSLGGCDSGFADCDRDPTNGCEHDLAPTGACPPPAFVAAESAAGSQVSALTLQKPPGVAAGDLLVAWIAVDAPATDAVPLSIESPDAGSAGGDGWLASQSTPSGYGTPRMRTRLFWKLAATSEPGDYRFTFGQATEASAVLAAFRDVDPIDPVGQAAFEVIEASSNDINCPERTPVRDASMVVALAAGSRTDATAVDGVGESGQPPAGYVLQAQTGSGAAGGTLVALATQAAPTPFTTDPLFSFTGDPADQTVGATLVLNPAPVATLPAPDVWVRVGSFTTPDATGGFDVTGLGRDDTKAVLLWAVGNRERGGPAGAHMVVSRGFAATDPDEGRSAGGWAEDGQADVLRFRHTGDALRIYGENATTPDVAAAFAGPIADGFRLDFGVASAGFVVNYLAIGGADCDADITQAPGDAVVSSAVKPELAFALGANLGAGDGVDETNFNLSFGAFNHRAGAFSLVQAIEEANGQALARIRSTAVGGQVAPGQVPPTLTWERPFEEVDPDHVELFDNNGANTDVLHYLVLDLGGLRTVVRTFSHRAGADGARQELGLPFTPQAVLMATAAASDERVDVYNSDRSSLGASDGTRQVATCLWSQSETHSRSQRHFDSAVVGSGPGCDPGDPDRGLRGVMQGRDAVRWADNADSPLWIGLVAFEDPAAR